jgi:hypothetical protein
MQVERAHTMQHDEAFLSLLSSQRDLLTKLQTENDIRRANLASRGLGGGSLLAPEKNGLMNRPIAVRRTSIDMLIGADMLLSKRFSLGSGYDPLFPPSFAFDGCQVDDGLPDDLDTSRSSMKQEKLGAEVETPNTRRKRRLSSLGFLSASFFEDQLKSSLHRNRDLMLSSMHTISNPRVTRLSQNDEEDDSDDDSDIDSVENETEHDADAVSLGDLDVEDSKVDPAEAKCVMETFTTAMERSQQSQQDIHDWDRKMGLKRSHSKTMRLSTRSRKKLRSVLKKEINSLALKL